MGGFDLGEAVRFGTPVGRDGADAEVTPLRFPFIVNKKNDVAVFQGFRRRMVASYQL